MKINIEKGQEAEQRFLQWMTHKNLLFAYIDQTPTTFSPHFKLINGKRPDYIICVKDLGTITVDVKSRQYSGIFETFILDEIEVQKLLVFQRMYRLPVWIAISHETIGYHTWYWISLNTIVDCVQIKRSTKSNDPFRPIPIQQCVTIGWNDGLGKLLE